MVWTAHLARAFSSRGPWTCPSRGSQCPRFRRRQSLVSSLSIGTLREVEYRFEENPIVHHEADGSEVDVVILLTPREGPWFVGVCGLEAAVGRYGNFRVDGVEVDPEDITLRVLVRKVYRPCASACRRAEDSYIST